MKLQRKRATPQAAVAGSERPVRHSAAIAALCALTLLVYANSFRAGFTLDNKGLLIEDPRLRAASSENVQQIFDHTYWWPHGESGLYRPVTTLSYLFNYSVLGNGGDPEGYHWVNLLLHLVNVLVVYALALRLWGEFWPSVFTAAIWAAHPVLTESVTNMVGRADLLAGMAVLGGLLLYLKSAESAGWRRWAWLAALTALSAFGMFAKESAAVIPAVIVLFELAGWRGQSGGVNPTGRESGRFRWVWFGFAATLLPLAVMLYRRSLVLAAAGPASFPFTDNPLVGADLWTRCLTSLKVMGLYLGLLSWPAKLSCDYSFDQIALARGSLFDWTAWMAVAAVIAIAAILYRRHKGAFFLLAFAFVAFLPSSNLLFPIGTIMAERLLYLPAIAFAGCIAAGVCAGMRRIRRPTLAPVLLGLLTALLAVRTLMRNADWQNDLTLAASAVSAAPDSFKAHKLMAEALFAADDSHSNIDQVIEEADKSVSILDPLPDYRNNAQAYRLAAGYDLLKGDMQFQYGGNSHGLDLSQNVPRPPVAQSSYRRALPLVLRYASITAKIGAAGSRGDAQRLLANTYLRIGGMAKALRAAEAARNLDPFQSAAYLQLADVLVASDRAGDAAVALFEGAMVNSDPMLRGRLLNLYRGLDPDGCALAAYPGGPGIDTRCPMVRQHLCQAASRALRTLTGAGRQDAASTLRSTMVRDPGCSTAELERPEPTQKLPR